jgi:hypothetical protein
MSTVNSRSVCRTAFITDGLVGTDAYRADRSIQIRLNTTDTLKIINGRLHVAHRRATDTLITSSLDLVRAG